MISELCTTGSGTRMRGSHGNIHSYHNNRSNFGANRAVSLDQYSTHNRRSSDGLQQVTSDNNVYYNQHQHRSLDGEVPATITESIPFNKSSANDDLSSGGDIRSDPLNSNSKPSDEKVKTNQLQQQNNQIQQPHKYTSNKILSTAGSAANNGTKSFMSRLRQFSSRFSFTFDRDAKRNNSTNTNITRNNNANESVLPITKGSFCCANKISSPLHHQHTMKQVEGVHAMPSNDLSARHRAHSLDVVRTRQYSSSNSENSRKSSRNDEHSHIMLMMEDNSNQTTTIGDGKSDADESFSAVCVGGGGDTGDPGNSI